MVKIIPADNQLITKYNLKNKIKINELTRSCKVVFDVCEYVHGLVICAKRALVCSICWLRRPVWACPVLAAAVVVLLWGDLIAHVFPHCLHLLGALPMQMYKKIHLKKISPLPAPPQRERCFVFVFFKWWLCFYLQFLGGLEILPLELGQLPPKLQRVKWKNEHHPK